MKKFLKFTICTLITITLFGCSQPSTKEKQTTNEQVKEDNSLSKVQERGELIIGTSADFAPREFHMMVDGKDTIVGYDIDIAKEIANDMGVELKVQDMSFDGLLTALNAGKVDMVIAGMAATPERLEAVDFSIPYGKSTDISEGQKIVVRKEDKDLYTIIESLTDEKLGVKKDRLQEQIAEKVGKNRTTITNSLRLLKLDNRIQDFIIELKLSQGHARALLPIENKDLQFEIAEKIIKEQLNVRQTEELVKKILEKDSVQKISKEKEEDYIKKQLYIDISKQLNEILGTKVNIKNNKNKGKIEIEYYSEEELDRLFCLFKNLQ